jgi:uncharacterized protein (DUF2236 family)
MTPIVVNRLDLETRLSEIQDTVKNPKYGIWGPDSMLWKVNRESAMFIGGARGVMLQLAYPSVAYALAQHSKVKADPFGRFKRTFDQTFGMVFGDLNTAFKSARMVHNIHSKITGVAAGQIYRANEEAGLLWVHSTLWETSILMYETFVGPLSPEEKERYYEETKFFAYLFGISDVALPPTWADFLAYNARMWASGLSVTNEAREITNVLFQPLPELKMPGAYYKSLTRALLPAPVAKAYKLSPTWLDNTNLAATSRGIRVSLDKLPDTFRYVPQYLAAMKRCA